jgi:hypothetical protein
VPSGPCLCGLCFRGGLPRLRFCVIATPPIGRTHNEQVWPVGCQFVLRNRLTSGHFSSGRYPCRMFTCVFTWSGGEVACSFLTLASSLMAAR